MSVAVVGTPQAGVFTSGTGVNYAPGSGANRAVMLALAHSSSSGGGTPVYTGVQPTFNSVNMTQVGSFIVNTTVRYAAVSMWLMLEASLPSISKPIVASWSDATDGLNEADGLATLWTLSGVNQTTPVSGTDSGTVNSATSVAGAGLAATTGGVVLFTCAFNPGSSSGITGPTGYTLDLPTTAFDFTGFAQQGHKLIGSAGTETPSVSWSGTASGAILTANFQQAVSDTSEVPTAGSVSVTGNTPTRTAATNSVLTPAVARLLEPRRRIFLPAWRRAA